MNFGSRLRTWWRAVRRREQLNAEIESELSFHIESYAEDLMRGGLSHEEAMRRARAELGGIAAQKENCRAAWGTRLWDELWADVRYGLRMLAKSPAFTAIAIVSLALGIGANTVVFTVTKSLLLDKLAVPHPDELRLLANSAGDKSVVQNMWGDFDNVNGREVTTSFSYPVYQFLRGHNHSLEDIFAFKPFGRVTATVDNKAEVLQMEMVSGNYYKGLEVKPILGRAIDDEDDGAVGSGPVVDIGYGYWTRRFGRSPDVIGKKIALNSIPITIIGVNLPQFTGAFSTQGSPDVFLPFSMQPIVVPKFKASLLTDKQLWWVLMMGRLKPGVPEQTAQAALNVSLNAAVRATMTVGKGDEVPSLYFRDGNRGQNQAADQFAKPAYVLMALAGFVLLLACANLANLLLARANSRQREMSVRLALGAGHARVLRQVFTESLMLSVAGGAAGLVIGYFGRNAIPRMLTSAWEPTELAIHFDWKIFAFATGVSILTGLLFGLAPAWQAMRTEVNSGLKDSAQTATQRRRNYAGRTIVVAQVALSMLLLVGAGLFVRTLTNLDNSHLGFQPKNILLFDLQPPRTRYAPAQGNALYHRVAEKLRTVPGVDSVSLSASPLVAGSMSNSYFLPEEMPEADKSKRPVADDNAVGEHFFKTMGIPLIAGRGFEETDTATSQLVAVVNESLAKKFFPGRDPIGMKFKASPDSPVWVEIVGICGDAKYDSLRRGPDPTFYTLYQQDPNGFESMTYEVHTRMEASAMVPLLRDVVAGEDKDLPLVDVRTQMEQIADTTQTERIFASLTSGFGLLALVLACIGIYGIMAYTVSRRTNEIGIRMALGAQPERVLRMVLREAGWLALGGVIVGLAAALGMGKLVASMLYGLKPYDPGILAGAGVLLLMIALAASWIPARRAASVDPMRALRHE